MYIYINIIILITFPGLPDLVCIATTEREREREFSWEEGIIGEVILRTNNCDKSISGILSSWTPRSTIQAADEDDQAPCTKIYRQTGREGHSVTEELLREILFDGIAAVLFSRTYVGDSLACSLRRSACD